MGRRSTVVYGANAAKCREVTVLAEYIEREAMLREVERRERLMVGNKTISVCALKQFIENRPAADVAPVVHGHFVHEGPRFTGGVDWWKCSNCGRLACGVETRFDYCPWCGAKMDESGEYTWLKAQDVYAAITNIP